MTQESTVLKVIFNDEVVLEFDRNTILPQHHQEYLEQMDEQMDQGIPVGDELIEAPRMEQRTQFVTHTLINALLEHDTDTANAMGAYLGTRVSDLAQVNCTGSESGDQGIAIKLIFNQDKESND